MSFKALHNVASDVIFLVSFPVFTSASPILFSPSRCWACSCKGLTHIPYMILMPFPTLFPLWGCLPLRLSWRCPLTAPSLSEARSDVTRGDVSTTQDWAPWALSIINVERELGKYLWNGPWRFGKTLSVIHLFLILVNSFPSSLLWVKMSSSENSDLTKTSKKGMKGLTKESCLLPCTLTSGLISTLAFILIDGFLYIQDPQRLIGQPCHTPCPWSRLEVEIKGDCLLREATTCPMTCCSASRLNLPL